MNVVNELVVFLARIGIIESKVGLAAVLLGNSEVKSDRLSMSDVQVAIRLWWESSKDSALSEGFVLSKDIWGVASIDITSY
jgi:hypothetical protein